MRTLKCSSAKVTQLVILPWVVILISWAVDGPASALAADMVRALLQVMCTRSLVGGRRER